MADDWYMDNCIDCCRDPNDAERAIKEMRVEIERLREVRENLWDERARFRARLAEAERWIRYWMPDPAVLHSYYRKPYAETEAFLRAPETGSAPHTGEGNG